MIMVDIKEGERGGRKSGLERDGGGVWGDRSGEERL